MAESVMYHEGNRQLQDQFDSRRISDRLEEKLMRKEFSADDKQFIEKLYQKAANLEGKFKDLVANNTRNWEVDRLPLTDRMILEMAIAELIIFPNIPVKVSMNEYIELAKNYSTPKSRQFINGILDVIAKELKESGDVKKSGRGLIDNR